MYCVIFSKWRSCIWSSLFFVWACDTFLDAESQALPYILASDRVSLKDGHYDVDQPERDEEDQGQNSSVSWSTELSANRASSNEEANDAKNSADNEDDDGEAERASWHEVALWITSSRLIDGGDQPWESKSQEHVYRVGARHVADGGVSVLLLLSSLHTGESIWQWGTESDESDCSNTWFDTEDASEEVGELTNNEGDKTDNSEGNEEAWNTAEVVSWWNDSEEEFPADGGEVENCVHTLDVLDLAIFTLGWMEHACSDELWSPGLLFLLVELGNKLSIGISLLLLFQIGDNVDNLKGFLGKFGAFWVHVLELEAESVVTVIVYSILWLWNKLDFDSFSGLSVLENKLTSGLLVVLSSLGNVILVAKINSLEVNSDATITTVLSNNLNLNVWLSWSNLDSLSILEANLTWLVIIDNGDASFGVLSNKFGVELWIVELNEEVLIWLPVVVILDYNVKSLGLLTVTEFNNTVKWHVVLVSLGIAVNGACTDRTGLLPLINNSDCQLAGWLTDRVM